MFFSYIRVSLRQGTGISYRPKPSRLRETHKIRTKNGSQVSPVFFPPNTGGGGGDTRYDRKLFDRGSNVHGRDKEERDGGSLDILSPSDTSILLKF